MSKGIATLLVLLLIPVILVVLFLLFTKGSPSPLGNKTSLMNSVNKAKNDLAKVSPMALWDFEYETKTWKSVGSPPTCPDPFTFPAPADLSLASGILYPGQIRGGDYKPHGGARFDNLPNNELNVYSPFDGKLYQAARHLESGEMQYSLYFINDCGMMYKLDHLRKLTDKFERLLEPIPTGAEGDSRTTMINPAVFISKGELVATEVGIIKTKNVFFDFGVYDLRQRNGVDYSGKDYFNIEQYGMHGVCWMDYLQEPDKSLSYSLPGADGQSGKKSDYCK